MVKNKYSTHYSSVIIVKFNQFEHLQTLHLRLNQVVCFCYSMGPPEDVGVLALELVVPPHCVDQAELEVNFSLLD